MVSPQVHYHKAENEINDTFNFYRSMLEDRKQDALKELDSTYNAKQVALSAMAQRMTESIERLFRGSEFIEKLVRHASTTEVLMFKKTLDSKLQSIMSQTPETNALNAFDIEFVSNYQAIQVGRVVIASFVINYSLICKKKFIKLIGNNEVMIFF